MGAVDGMRFPGGLRPTFRLAVSLIVLATFGCEEDVARPGGTEVASVTVDPPTMEMSVGDRFQATAVIRNSGELVIPARATWSTEDPAVATVDSTGTIEAIGPGTALVRATVDEHSGVTAVTVDLPEPPAWSEHTCAAASTGAVYCWGRGDSGELGHGARGGRAYPTRVEGIVGAATTTMGAGHTCVTDVDGNAWCWGRGEEGQLGNGGSVESFAPVRVSGSARWSRLDGGGRHTCGRTDSGLVACWGWNSAGQLGNGTTVSLVTPQFIASPSGSWLDVSAGGRHTCGVTSNEEVWCWGANGRGQLGGGSTTDSSIPARVASDLRFATVTAGPEHTCATTRSGEAWCWGANGRAQLGDASVTDRSVPVRVTGPPTAFVRLVAGGGHTCGLSTTGGVWCWGAGEVGQIGDGAGVLRGNATPVALGSAASEVLAGSEHACARTDDGWLRCWGANRYGQLGSDGGYATLPRSVLRPGGDVAATLILQPGEVELLWGDLQRIDVTVRNAADFPLPASVTWTSNDSRIADVSDPGVVRATGYGITTVTANVGEARALATVQVVGATLPDEASHACARKADGSVYCWGLGWNGQMGNGARMSNEAPGRVSNVAGAVAVTDGLAHSCALLDSGRVDCWGSGLEGQLGSGVRSEGNELLPARTAGEERYVQIRAGGRHTCGITDTGNIRCWGSNANGQIGDGSSDDALVPTAPAEAGVGGWTSVAAGGAHSCALDGSGAAWCWGGNAWGQLGNGTNSASATPVAVSGGIRFRGLTAGTDHTCGIDSAGRGWCWGRNDRAQHGDGRLTSTPVPREMSLGVLWSALSAGRAHTCGLAVDGVVRCWGEGESGQLGDGTGALRGNPTIVPLPESAIDLAVHGDHSCVLLKDLVARCWGLKSEGQLGVAGAGPIEFAPRAIPDEQWVGLGR